MQSPPFPRYLVAPRSKYSPQHHVLKHPQLPFLPQCQRPSFTPIQDNMQNYSSIYDDLQLLNEIKRATFEAFNRSNGNKLFGLLITLSQMSPVRCRRCFSIIFLLHFQGKSIKPLSWRCRQHSLPKLICWFPYPLKTLFWSSCAILDVK